MTSYTAKNMSSLQRKLFEKNLASLPPLPPSHSKKSGLKTKKLKQDFSPLSWSNFFDYSKIIEVEKSSFCLYMRGSTGPVLFLLHGGGHSALSWACFAEAITKLIECRVVAMDFRGHGQTKTDDDTNLSAQTLVSDVAGVIEALYPDHDVPIILLGHSMGGAIAVRVAATKGLIPSLVGLVVIDVVEGSAVESLPSMQSFLKGLPKNFKSLEHAIEWSVNNGHIKNLMSAKVSMPGQVKRIEPDISDVSPDAPASIPTVQVTQTAHGEPIMEEDEETVQSVIEGEPCVTAELLMPPPSATPSKSEQVKYAWRIDLSKTEAYWKGWFEGLSKKFLSIAVPRLLLLAAVETLDKELTIGHMQGKFQMQVLAGCGHTVHEDLPEKVSEIIAGFMVRYKVAAAKEGFQQPFAPAC